MIFDDICLYFKVIEKPDNRRNPNEIHPGEKLGVSYQYYLKQ